MELVVKVWPAKRTPSLSNIVGLGIAEYNGCDKYLEPHANQRRVLTRSGYERSDPSLLKSAEKDYLGGMKPHDIRRKYFDPHDPLGSLRNHDQVKNVIRRAKEKQRGGQRSCSQVYIFSIER